MLDRATIDIERNVRKGIEVVTSSLRDTSNYDLLSRAYHAIVDFGFVIGNCVAYGIRCTTTKRTNR